GLARLLPLDAEILASLPHRGQGDLVEAAEHLLVCALSRRRRATRLGVPVGAHGLGCDRAGSDVAEPRALFAEGPPTRGLYAANEALSLPLRPLRPGGPRPL